MNEKNNVYLKHFSILFVLTIVVFFPLSFHLFPMKYDAIDCFFPWRYFISSEFSQGNFPYWNPYQDLGYPIHADPSSGSWYPIVWLFSLFGTYSAYTISLEYLLHIFFAGIGSYLLFSYFKFSPKVVFFGAIAYMFNGFFIGNAQHIPYIVSACWFPYVIYFFFKVRDEVRYWNSICGAFFLYLMITGGYPAFTIILFYLFFVFTIIHSIELIKAKEGKKWFAWMLRNTVFLVATLLFSIGIFVSIYIIQPYLSRLGNFTLEQALYSPFSIQSFISFLAPYVTTIKCKYELFNSDLAMRNAYFGFIPFVLFLVGLTVKKSKDIQILFWYGLFCLTSSVGDVLPVRKFLFEYVPMMNVFRFPSVFRAFFILSALLVGLNYLNHYSFEKIKEKALKITLIIVALFFISAILFSRFQGFLNFKHFVLNDLALNEETVTIWQHLVFSSSIQLLFTGMMFYIIIKKKDFLKWGLILLVLDVFINIQLASPFTVYSNEITGKEIQKTFYKGERKSASLCDSVSIKELDNRVGLGIPFWQNEATFQKHLASEGFNSFSFKNFEALEDNFPNYFSQLIKNRNALLSDKILHIQQLRNKEKANQFDSMDLFFTNKDFLELKKLHLMHSTSDRWVFTSIQPTKFILTSTSSQNQLLTLFQKNYVGWKALIDNKPTKIYTSSTNFMSIVLPKGKHTVKFYYSNAPIFFALISNLLFLSLFLSLLIFQLFKFFRTKQLRSI
jgi:Bacterial membrane protein YfhO